MPRTRNNSFSDDLEIHEMAKRIRKKRKINKIEARLEDKDIGRSQKPRKTKVCSFSFLILVVKSRLPRNYLQFFGFQFFLTFLNPRSLVEYIF